MESASQTTPNPSTSASTNASSPDAAEALAALSDFEDPTLEASEAGLEAADEDLAAVAPSNDGASLPVPVGELTQKSRTSLWRRIGLGRGAREERVTNEALRTRLDGVALRLESIERAIAQGEDRLDERLARLWEVEEQLEQLSDLSERATEARDAAQEAAAVAGTLGRGITAIAVLLTFAILAGVAVVALPYLQ